MILCPYPLDVVFLKPYATLLSLAHWELEAMSNVGEPH
jgi:hypothetical protein